jgi:hypothetical protein
VVVVVGVVVVFLVVVFLVVVFLVVVFLVVLCGWLIVVLRCIAVPVPRLAAEPLVVDVADVVALALV